VDGEPSRVRVAHRLPLVLALLATPLCAAACGGKRTSAATTTATVTRTVTVPATTPTVATTTPTTAAGTTTTPPNPHAPLSLHAAELVLGARAFDVLTERDYRPDQQLKVLIGIRRMAVRAEQAFFFVGDRFIGTDTAAPSGAIEVLAQSDGSVTLGYGLYRPGDALCCASAGVARVTYTWNGTRLLPQGTIPSADPAAARSRR
jgi:hypothetical protein